MSEYGVWGHTALAEAEDAVVIPELNLTLALVQIYEEAGVAPLQASFLRPRKRSSFPKTAKRLSKTVMLSGAEASLPQH